MPCVTGARFNMTADILRQVTNDTDADPVDETGEWVLQQDPDSGEIIRVWQPSVQDNPATPDVDESVVFNTQFPCIARGVITGGMRSIGALENWSEVYEGVDKVTITFPNWVTISKRDRITNIRDSRGNVVWKEEEQPEAPPTVFSVVGVAPIPDPFGAVVEYVAMLERSQIQ